MSSSVERFLYLFDKNREACERECDSMEEALDLACEHLEWGQGCPKAIWREGVLVMNLNQIAKEWMQRQHSKLAYFKADDEKA